MEACAFIAGARRAGLFCPKPGWMACLPQMLTEVVLSLNCTQTGASGAPLSSSIIPGNTAVPCLSEKDVSPES